ncbi:aldehyde dehydrogenase B [Vibrio ishigakensis]|uniref:Aldehyde dehydrogenase B n=1 Tax=Vibrio ishigakensis TaxID=1481914 RepID=A0A0B8Q6H7_9VIBR|nr:aldehyde dehydrogenase B [Vibrio ishigakensis]
MDQIRNQSLLNAVCGEDSNAITVFNPVDNQPLANIPSLSIEQIEEIIQKSKQAQIKWEALTASYRAGVMRKWYQLVIENCDDLARLMTLEQGKPLAEAKGEVAYGASFIQWFAEEAKRTYGETIPTPASDKRLLTMKQAVGVTAAITPWNFPIAMITRKVAPALAAGCSCIVKPANQTPLSAYAVAELAYQAGIPKDLFVVVNNHSSVLIGDLFCNHPDIKKLSFTGSTEVGRALLKQTSQTIKRTSMELGGNAPFIVFEDADIAAAVKGAVASKFRNAGQTCVCANRFYVHDAVYEQFMDQFVTQVSQLKVGNGLDETVQVGPLIDAKAKRSVLELIETARSQGAELELGGMSMPSNFIEPTIYLVLRRICLLFKPRSLVLLHQCCVLQMKPILLSKPTTPSMG